MSILSKEKGLYDSEIEIISQSDDCSIYRMKTDGGDGIMTSYQVFLGVELIYNDFHMGNCLHNKRPCKDIMEINHCRQGRFECDFNNGTCVYLEEGDLSVNMLSNMTKNSCFPLEHYYGVSVVIDLEEASKSISRVLNDISIDLYVLRDKLCANDQCFIMRATDSVKHIFLELYKVPDKIKRGYFKLKVLELLLFLSAADVSEEQRQYFPKNQVNTVKLIKEYLTDNLEHHDTLEELSARFNIPLTTMKLCFKGVYGTSIYAFMRAYRMQAAAVLLRQSTDNISVIAGRVGYANSSKFASSFKAIMGMSPLEYRKGHRLNEALEIYK
ncbi:AraC family transcriptional regulator [Mobilisporobacter senegalensis]|uniref:AraC family transcriptional regulator n=1 Tax=Mobilisporobacter senegalensis TaxID=1329262 RepID=A0A3N1XD22_9FIRM|nr:AraC family transcriptional regulator [Mobilisporobacter senegalensis]ROR23948.1 AraC family transcriptional regulator [Mobilisporobacter senegalensis]